MGRARLAGSKEIYNTVEVRNSEAPDSVISIASRDCDIPGGLEIGDDVVIIVDLSLVKVETAEVVAEVER